MSQASTRPTLYKGYRFPLEIISRCVWLYYHFGVSLRDVPVLMLGTDSLALKSFLPPGCWRPSSRLGRAVQESTAHLDGSCHHAP
jgi:hypothetical protein